MSLSIIVYGRNDAHGYNLHKRVAISLNCIAEVLSGPGDEILFVDYNTPDELPTFPEAIEDTLTAKVRRLLRVFRVRPRVHALYAARTHLPVLEPVARNIGLRRSNPDNRWVLSTNTDMIFTPKAREKSLTAVVEALPDGFFHLPRFELPEGLWEAFDRRDPVTTIENTRAWARQFHLEEVVYGSGAIIYDAPGDFQLALRRDLWAIDGFNEEMILGWHVDSNLARRMQILRGGVDRLEAQLCGYHCDHTRLATLVHRADRVENDSRRYVDELDRPDLPEQAGQWGLPDEHIESFHLAESASRRYLAALRKTLTTPQDQPSYGHYTSEAFNKPQYQWRHALPFLLDSVACCAPDEVFAYAGASPDLLDAFAQALSVMAPRAKVLVPDNLGWLPLARNVVAADWDAWYIEASTFVFEIGWARDDDMRLGALRSADVLAMFGRLTVEHGELVQGRRLIGVNCVNTAMEAMINRVAACSPTPFGSRVRHGYFTAPRYTPLTRPVDELAASRFGQTDPLMSHLADRFTGGLWTDWSWERVAILAEVERARLIPRHGPRPRRRVLLVAHLPEALAAMLADSGFDVDFVDPLEPLGETPTDWRADLHDLGTLVPDPVGVMGRDTVYDAVVCPQSALLIRGSTAAGLLTADLHARLRPGGLLLFSLHGQAGLSDDPTAMRADDLVVRGFGGRFAKSSGYQFVSSAVQPPSVPSSGDTGVASVWCWRKQRKEPLVAATLASAFLSPFSSTPMSLSTRMRAKDWVVRGDGVWLVAAGAPEGHALFGPYLPLAGGAYRASIETLGPLSDSDDILFRLEVAFGDETVAAADHGSRTLLSGKAFIAFDAPPQGIESFEIRLTHFGRADLRFGDLVLACAPASQGGDNPPAA